ncbi:MAG TPA: dihydroorotate dehydrogenase electron transfer subunit [Candidatus Limnocylindrales bacterium]
MRQSMALITENEVVTARSYRLRLLAPDIAENARPGQFVHVRVTPVAAGAEPSYDPLLRRPLSLLRISKASGEIECLYDVVGRGTALLSQARPGQSLDVLGPLGRPFDLGARTRQALLVGGGVGIAPLIALAELALARDVAVTLLAGFRSATQAYPASLLPPEVEYVVTTDDGSAGRPGRVTEVLGEYTDWADKVFACGPLPMLRALSRLDLPRRLPVQVSMEEHMGCAMGVCLGCVVPTKHGLQRVCRDGPVFGLREIDWLALESR